MCVGAAIACGALTFDEAFAATDSEVLWLIVLAFLLAKGFEKSGLGERIADLLVSRFGGSTRGLALSLAVGEAALAPGMPSTTARAAGIFLPVIESVSAASGSFPDAADPGGPETRRRIGSYLIQSQLQSSNHTCSLFLTASAQNLLCLQLAEAAGGVDLGNHFLVWSEGALVPGVIGTLAMPLLVYRLQPPAVTETPEAPRLAAARLRQLGKLTQDETIMLATVGMALTLWLCGEQYGIPPAVAAMLACGTLLATGVLDWRRDCLVGSPQAWDTLFWFGVLISMSLALQDKGVIAAFTDWASGQLAALHLPWLALFGALHLQFFLLHYMFASKTAHVGALYAAFLSLMLAGGVPPKLAAMSLAYNVCINGGLTHYASGQAAVYYGSGFLNLREIFSAGAACGAAGLAIWGAAGMAWWKVLGWW
ncbi:MAG: Sodium/sulfate symporter [Monoraphidium minutum]|nr:MAG: Sodium/sulfate symporter [Monoraphidium minutum]